MKALEVQIAHGGVILYEDQVRVLESAKEEKVAHREIMIEHAGYLGSQETTRVLIEKVLTEYVRKFYWYSFSSRVFIAKLYR